MSQRLTVSQYVSNPSGEFYAAATGGASTSQITADGKRYTLHTFTSSADLTVNGDGYLDFLVVGAGGGLVSGSALGGGGGGGGAVVFYHRVYVVDGTYPVVIGAGVSGSYGAPSYVTEPNGTRLVYAGGGSNGSYVNGPINFHGSTGGGGGRYGGGLYTGDPTPAGYGFKGGSGSGAGASGGSGGGGGATAVGANASGTTGGAGGAGLDVSSILGQSAGTTYLGGGGGGHGATVGANGSGTGAANTGGGIRATSETNLTGYSGVVYVRSAPQ